METTIKCIAGKYFKPVTLKQLDEETIKVTFPYDQNLITEIKVMEGARWNPEEKYWTIRKSQRNVFAFQYLSGQNPYSWWERPLINKQPRRKCYNHQVNMFQCGLTYRQVIFAAEAGVGKTLSAIEIMEASGTEDWIWVGPKSALRAVELEFLKWESFVWPRTITYDGLKKYINSDMFVIPKGIIFDESQKIRNPTAQRSVAARYIADKMREKYGREAYIIEMSGTPAPNAPTDWWHLAEVVQPGFLREGSFEKFKRRLGLIVQKESIAGGVYPELVSWYDDENKCKNCGKYKDDMIHSGVLNESCNFVKSENEVKVLYERLKGLVVIHLKKNVLSELPEKNYKILRCEPSESILRAAKLILSTAKNVVTANMLLRELSDGFQYKDMVTGEDPCPGCNGNGIINHPECIEWKCINCNIEGEGEYPYCPKCESPISEENKKYQTVERDCFNCGGQRTVPRIDRTTVQMVECPKDEILKDLLEEHEEVGRLVVYAGFTGSVDRVVDICIKQNWHTIRVDGRGWNASWGTSSDTGMLKEFQRIGSQKYLDKIVFIGQPEAAGLGLTLTESPTEFYFSNSFKPEARSQSEDRIHRPGMDLNKGATIIDCFHLPSDEKVYNALKLKKQLQDMSLGEFQDIFNETFVKKRIF